MSNSTEHQFITFANGDMASGQVYEAGVHAATFLRPDGRTFTALMIPHGYPRQSLRDMIQTHAPGAPLHMSRTLANDPDASTMMLVMWSYMLVFDTTDTAREVAA